MWLKFGCGSFTSVLLLFWVCTISTTSLRRASSQLGQMRSQIMFGFSLLILASSADEAAVCPAASTRIGASSSLQLPNEGDSHILYHWCSSPHHAHLYFFVSASQSIQSAWEEMKAQRGDRILKLLETGPHNNDINEETRSWPALDKNGHGQL